MVVGGAVDLVVRVHQFRRFGTTEHWQLTEWKAVAVAITEHSEPWTQNGRGLGLERERETQRTDLSASSRGWRSNFGWAVELKGVLDVMGYCRKGYCTFSLSKNMKKVSDLSKKKFFLFWKKFFFSWKFRDKNSKFRNGFQKIKNKIIRKKI